MSNGRKGDRLDVERGNGTGDAPEVIRDDHCVRTGIICLRVSADETAAACARDICGVESPLITQRRRAGRNHAERRVLAGVHGETLRWRCDPRRAKHRERGNRAGHRACHISHND